MCVRRLRIVARARRSDGGAQRGRGLRAGGAMWQAVGAKVVLVTVGVRNTATTGSTAHAQWKVDDAPRSRGARRLLVKENFEGLERCAPDGRRCSLMSASLRGATKVVDTKCGECWVPIFNNDGRVLRDHKAFLACSQPRMVCTGSTRVSRHVPEVSGCAAPCSSPPEARIRTREMVPWVTAWRDRCGTCCFAPSYLGGRLLAGHGGLRRSTVGRDSLELRPRHDQQVG